MADLATLLTPLTAEQVSQSVYSMLASAGFPVTTWRTGDVARTLVWIFSRVISDVTATVQKIAAGGYLDTSSEDWLSLLAESHYGIRRRQAVATEGFVQLSTASGTGPYSYAPGELVVGTYAGDTYTNVDAISVTTSGINALVHCSVTGSAGNVGPGTITRIVAGGRAGMTVAHSGAQWPSTPGTDLESDEELKNRCRARWSSLGTGGTAMAIRFRALSIASTGGARTVTRVSVKEAANGHVTIKLGGSNTAPDAMDVAFVAAGLEEYRPLCLVFDVSAASTKAIGVRVVGRVQAAFEVAAKAQMEKEFAFYLRTVPIGGRVEPTGIIAALRRAPGIIRLEIQRNDTGHEGELIAQDDPYFTLAAGQMATVGALNLAGLSFV